MIQKTSSFPFYLIVRRICFLLAFCTLPQVMQAQQDSLKKEWVGLPIVYYTPETKLAFGVGSLWAFYPKGLTTEHKDRSSNIQFGALYTLEKQLLTYLSYNIFNPIQRWEISGEFGYYNYRYDYWGIGNRTSSSNAESYAISFPRIEAYPRYLLNKNLGIGLAIDANYYYNLELKDEGLLSLDKTTGVEGGLVTGLGLSLRYDSRDHTNFPLSGLFVDLKGLAYDGSWGSDYQFKTAELDIRYFKTVHNWVWASQVYFHLNEGTIPFYEMALLGGGKKMRGYYKGRYRDNNLWLIQTEMRLPVWKRFFLVPFLAVGDVFSKDSSLQLKWAGGGGIRFTVKEEKRVNIRFDVGYGEDFQFYFSILEAF